MNQTANSIVLRIGPTSIAIESPSSEERMRLVDTFVAAVEAFPSGLEKELVRWFSGDMLRPSPQAYPVINQVLDRVADDAKVGAARR